MFGQRMFILSLFTAWGIFGSGPLGSVALAGTKSTCATTFDGKKEGKKLEENPEFTAMVDDFFSHNPGGKNLSGVIKIVGPGKNYERAFNKSDDEKNKDNDFDTSFLIASTSKQFAAAAILKLEEAGKLSVADPISKFFPEIPVDHLTSYEGKQVEIWNLLTHTSGMYDASEDDEFSGATLKKPLTGKDLVKILKNHYLEANPGTVFNYTDTNYDLIGEIVRRVTKKSYSKFMNDTFFKPLGMDKTQVGYSAKLNSHLARSYTTKAKRNGSTRKDYFKTGDQKIELVSDIFANGNIFSSANDLTTWLQGLLKGRILSKASTRKMWASTDVSDYGFGWSIQENDYKSVVYQHNGGWAGYTALIAVSPTDGTTLVWLSNAPVDDVYGDDFRTKLLELVWEKN